jgi:hypothetical protein
VLLAASVSTDRKELLAQRWRRERTALGAVRERNGELLEGAVVLRGVKGSYRLPASGELGPACIDKNQPGGLFAILDWASGEVVWQRSWRPTVIAPIGFCLSDRMLYLGDEWGAAVFAVDVFEDPGRLLRRISHPYLNDVHGVYRSRRGLLIASAGTDAIVELDLDGNLLYEWWAADHGYTETTSGLERVSGRGMEHRHKRYHTRYQTTHLNEALFRDADERYLLAVLPRQGQIVQIDRHRPAADQSAEVLVDGLEFPHGLRRTPSGWMIASTESNEVLLMDDLFRFIDRISYKCRWIHDALMLSSGEIVINDPTRSVLAAFSGPPWQLTRAVPYPTNWRVFRVVELADGYEQGFSPSGWHPRLT